MAKHELSPETEELIAKIAREENIPRYEVIRRAVALHKFVEDERAQGARLVIVDHNDKVLREIVPNT